MRVRVLVFGLLRDRLGGEEHVLDLADGVTVAAVSAWARGRLGDERLARSLATAVNREYAEASTVLREGDEVALLPPVSGGQVEPVRNRKRLRLTRVGM